MKKIKYYYTIDIIDKEKEECIAENMNEGFETLEEALNYCIKYNPSDEYILALNIWYNEDIIDIKFYDSYSKCFK